MKPILFNTEMTRAILEGLTLDPAAGEIWERTKPCVVGICSGRGRIVRKQ